MGDGLIPVDWLDVIIGLGLIAVAIGISYFHGFGLEKDIFIGALRSVVQLAILGYVLHYVFKIDQIWVVVLILLVMAFIGALTAKGRIKKPYPGALWVLWISITLGSFFAMFYITVVALSDSHEVSLTPRYLIPLGGMAIGNTLNAVTLAGERFRSELEARRDQVETLLAMGADSRRASYDCMKASVTAGAIPMINSMMVIGLIQIPGMMTGILVSEGNPVNAAMYQMLVMFMIVGGQMSSMTMVLTLAVRSYFTKDHQLRRELL